MILNAIKQMERASRNDAGVVSLAQGIPYGSSHEQIRVAAMEAIKTGKADCYSDPQGILELREAISATLTAQGMVYSSEEVLVTAGAIEALNTVLHTVVSGQRNEVIMPVPVYSAYSRAIALAGGQSVPICLAEENGWALNVDLVRQAITGQTAAILLCNPNNPTGSVYPESVMVELAELAVDRGIVLITDEVYCNMLYGQANLFSPAMMPKYRTHVIRIISFSKDFALTGWRIGFLHADLSRVQSLTAVHDTIINCAPVVSQYAALAALQQRVAILQTNSEVYTRHLDTMVSYLDQLGDKVSYCRPEGAYFIFVKISGVRDSTTFCLDLLQAEKVAVVPGSDFGPGGEGHIRLCFGRSAASVHTGMQRLVHYINR